MHERMVNKTTLPTNEEMLNWIGQPLVQEWTALRQFLAQTYAIEPIFNAGGKRYGWNLQYRISGRPLCEMYPEQGSFTALVILGKVELDQAMQRLESFGPVVRQALSESPRYHDGCWMYIGVSDPLTSQQAVQDIAELILLKRKPPKKSTPSD